MRKIIVCLLFIAMAVIAVGCKSERKERPKMTTKKTLKECLEKSKQLNKELNEMEQDARTKDETNSGILKKAEQIISSKDYVTEIKKNKDNIRYQIYNKITYVYSCFDKGIDS